MQCISFSLPLFLSPPLPLSLSLPPPPSLPPSLLQVLDLREQLTSQASKLRAKDQYLQQADTRYLELETQLLSTRKELERLVHEQEQLASQALPEHLKMVAVATGGGVSLGDVIRLQGELWFVFGCMHSPARLLQLVECLSSTQHIVVQVLPETVHINVCLQVYLLCSALSLSDWV